MGNQLKKLGDFNEVIEYYQDILSYVASINPRGAFNAKAPSKCVAYDRAFINNLAISVAQNFDFIEEHNLPNIDDEILEELEEFCEDINYPKFMEDFKQIMEDNKLTPFNALKQIRNALLHGDYELEIVTPTDYTIYEIQESDSYEIQLVDAAKLKLNGQSIKATLEYPKMIHLIESFFECVRLNRFPSKNIEFVLAGSKYEACKNRHELAKFMEGYMIYEITPIGKTEKGNKDEIIDTLWRIAVDKYPEHIDSLPMVLNDLDKNLELCDSVLDKNQFEIELCDEKKLEERRAFISSYIEYLGFDVWHSLYEFSLSTRNAIFTDFYASTYGHTSLSGISNRCCTAVRNYSVALMNKRRLKEFPALAKQFEIIIHETPIIYGNLMLGMLNYSCGYVKENNSNEGSNLFDYHNMDTLKTLAPTIDRMGSIQKGVDSEPIKTSLDNQISGLESQKSNLEKGIEKINKNINDRNPKKAEFEEAKKKQEERIHELEERINGLRVRKEQYGETYDDYSEFFRHMRNSIAHGRYTIDYSKALKTKDFSRIKYTFKDYESDDKVNPSFEITLTAKQIYKIVRAVQERVNNQTRLEGSHRNIDYTNIKEVISPEELAAVKKPTAKDLQDSGFIKEEDKVDSFELGEPAKSDKIIGEVSHEDK